MIFELGALAIFYGTVGLAGVGCAASLISGTRSWVEFLAYAWLLGCLLISVALFVSSQILPAPWNGVTVWGGALLVAMAGWRRLHRGKLQLVLPRRFDRPEWALLAMIGVGAAWYLWKLSRQSLGWDGLLVWEFKARIAFANGGAVPLRYYSDPACGWSHPGYPQFLPMLETWFYLRLGDVSQLAVKWVLAPFYLALLALLVTAVVQFGGTRKAGLLAAAFFPFIAFPLVGSGSLGAGYCDFPLSVFYLAAVVALIRDDFILFTLLAGALPWLKRDGIVLCGSLLMLKLLLTSFESAGSIRKFILQTFFIIIPPLAWQAWLRHVGAGSHEDFAPITLSTLQENLPRLGGLIWETGRELADFRKWSLLWVGFAAVAFLRRRGKVERLLILAVAMPLLADAAIFLFSSWPSFLSHFQAAFPRLVMQVAPLAWVVTIALAGEGGDAMEPGCLQRLPFDPPVD